MSPSAAQRTYIRYKTAVAGRALPLALIDLDALEANIGTIAHAVGTKKLRIASKSVRSIALLRRIRDRCGAAFGGVMTYAAAETLRLASAGYTDLVLAYPTLQRDDTLQLARANGAGASAAVVVDAVEHLAALDAAAAEVGTRVPVVVEVDVAYRPIPGVNLGVRRSPLRDVADVVAFARRATAHEHLTFRGIMAYEAQVASVPDHDPFAPGLDAARRAMKALSRRDVAERRHQVVRALTEASLTPAIVNGGGTGSLGSSSVDGALTEVTAGSGFLDSHLFDHFRDVPLEPAAYFALQIVRVPARGFVTCLGGGYIASGAPGMSRLPIPALPAGVSLTALEGAGEVQTPLALTRGIALKLGDPVFFRHAKAGELAEHFNAYALLRGDAIEGEAPTYRGLGFSFLG